MQPPRAPPRAAGTTNAANRKEAGHENRRVGRHVFCKENLAKYLAALGAAGGRCYFLLLVQKKVAKENDTQEGKISVSPPPEDLPH